MLSMRSVFVSIAALALVACSSADENAGALMSARQAVTAPSPWPLPVRAAASAPPRILALWMNETRILPGTDWRGRIVTTTNVASVEVRTESFSFTAHQERLGEFSFDQHVLDIVPQYKRPYVLHVIARTAADDSDVRRVPISF